MLGKSLRILKCLDEKYLNHSLIRLHSWISWILHTFHLAKLDQKLIIQTLEPRRSRFLHELCQRHGTDKGSLLYRGKPWPEHTFADIYTILFESRRFEILRVFEMGIGTNNRSIPANMFGYGKPGASLRVWRDFFPNATIFGADIDNRVLFQEERIHTLYMDQLNVNSINEFWLQLNLKDFDIIIDDGLHTVEAAINLFSHSFQYLKSGGIYIIEDLTAERIQTLGHFFKRQEVEFSVYSSHRFLHSVGDNNLMVIHRY